MSKSLLIVSRQPGANIIEATDAIHEQLPILQDVLGPQVKLNVMDDRSPSIRASLEEAKAILVATDADKGRDETAIRRELGSIARRQQRWPEARAELDLALARFRALPKPDASEIARTLAEREMLDAQTGVQRRDCAQAREAVTMAATASRVNAAERDFLQIVLAGCLADAGERSAAAGLLAAHAEAVRATPAQPLRQHYLDYVEKKLK